jgi:lambda family phage minor tail protein L
MSLSAVAYIEKNKVSSSKVWLVLLEITMPNDTTFRIVRNSENVTWPVTSGDLYTAFPFEMDEVGDSKGEVPKLEICISNVTRILEPYLEAQDGLIDSIVKLYVVNSTHVTTPSLGAGVNNSNPELELEYEITECFADAQWVHFTLGAMNPFNKRFPRNKVWKNICPYKEFNGDRCQYAGAATSCDRSLATCRSLGNSMNFGGAPGVGSKGVYV